jgi:hypothetical protein
MIKECLSEITHPRYKEVFEIVRQLIDNYDDYQLEYALVNGIGISENIIIQKYPNGAFNCFNRDKMIKGHLPICRLIETKLNQKLTKLVYS